MPGDGVERARAARRGEADELLGRLAPLEHVDGAAREDARARGHEAAVEVERRRGSRLWSTRAVWPARRAVPAGSATGRLTVAPGGIHSAVCDEVGGARRRLGRRAADEQHAAAGQDRGRMAGAGRQQGHVGRR